VKKGYTPLHYASHNGHAGCVTLLLEYGSSCHLPSLANKSTRSDHVMFIGADVNIKDQDGQTPLHAAAHSGKQEVLLLLLEHMRTTNTEKNLEGTKDTKEQKETAEKSKEEQDNPTLPEGDQGGSSVNVEGTETADSEAPKQSQSNIDTRYTFFSCLSLHLFSWNINLLKM